MIIRIYTICYSNSIVLVLLGVMETNAGCNHVTLPFGFLRFIFDLNHKAARFKTTYGTYQHSANGVLLYQFVCMIWIVEYWSTVLTENG